MDVRSLIIVSLFLTASFAGCIGQDDKGPAPAEDVNPNNNTTINIPEGRDAGAAYEETNATEDGVGGMAHDHDYWDGKTRMRIMEDTVAMQPYPDDSNRAYTSFRITPPGMIFEGTGSVEVTITNPRRHACEGEFTFNGYYVCTDTLDDIRPYGIPAPEVPPASDPGLAGPLQLQYMHAATSEWQDGGTLEWDTPTSLEVNDPAQTDMPHSSASVWRFRVLSPQAQDVTLLFDVVVEIVKSDEPVEWPGHPDFYADRPWRKVFSGPASTSDSGVDEGAATGATGETTLVQPDRLVSWGTRSLYAWVNISNVNGALTPTHWYLEWHNATGDWKRTNPFGQNYTAGDTSYLFVLPVDDTAMDSPYSGTSRWEFAFAGAYTSPLISCLSGCMQYTVDYNLDLLSTNQTLPDDAYTVPPPWADDGA